MGSTRRKFTPQYKAEAVELVTSSGRPIAEIARDLGINDGTLTAAAGQSALAPAIAHRLMNRMRDPETALSSREIEVLGLAADGLSNAEIAGRLFLTQATVKSHLVHIYDKLGVDSRTSAVAAARDRDLIRR